MKKPFLGFHGMATSSCLGLAPEPEECSWILFHLSLWICNPGEETCIGWKGRCLPPPRAEALVIIAAGRAEPEFFLTER